MSNVSSLIPYAARRALYKMGVDGLQLTGACIKTTSAGVSQCAVSLHKWAKETPRPEVLKEIDQQQEATLSPKPTIAAQSLHFRDMASFLDTVQDKGFKPIENFADETTRLFQDDLGTIISIAETDKGIDIGALGNDQVIDTLATSHVLKNTVESFERQGLEIRRHVTAEGRTVITAEEKKPLRDGKARVSAVVDEHGGMNVDIEGIRGHRCEKVVKELADNAQMKVVNTQRKRSFFQLPGESAKTKQRV